jgi:hypothetical protein
MPKGILLVETHPVTPEQEAAYHEWYDKTHLAEIVALDGFVSARRFAPVGEDGRFVAIYEIEADDLEVAAANLSEAAAEGRMSSLELLQLDPLPSIRLLREISSYRAERT